MKDKKIIACLCHLGYNMWADPTEKDGIKGYYYGQDRDITATPRLRFRREIWDKVVDMLVDAGCNMIVLDIGEGIRFDCAPEIAAEDAWTKDEMKAELARLRGLGFEVIPKLNFSTCHDEWMGIYSRMVSTPPYYKLVKEIIAETAELFDYPRFFHIGMDEEGYGCQSRFNMVVIRQGELWWHDFNFICDCVRAAGCRPWMWADYVWEHKDIFLERMPRDVLLSNWYYGDFETENVAFTSYKVLDEAGFDQIPTGSNWSNRVNLMKTVEYCTDCCADERLLGFMQTIWYSTAPENLNRYEEGIEDLANAAKVIKK